MSATTAVAKPGEGKAVSKKDKMQNFLVAAAAESSLRGGLTKEDLAKAAALSIQKNPKLVTKDTDMRSLHLAIIDAGQIGLLPDGHQAALVPYKNKVQLQPMVWGLHELMRRSGEVKKIETAVVISGDEFRYHKGLNPDLVHVPTTEPDPNKMTHTYAIAWLSNGETIFEVMTKAQVDGIRARSKAKDSGPWVTDYLQMARKTVLKRLSKYVPMSAEVRAVIQKDDEVEYQEAVVESEEVEKKTRTDSVKEKLGLSSGADVRGDEDEAPAEIESEVEEEEADGDVEDLFPLAEEEPAEEVGPDPDADLTPHQRARLASLRERIERAGIIDFETFRRIATGMGTDISTEAFFAAMSKHGALDKAMSQAVDLLAKEGEA